MKSTKLFTPARLIALGAISTAVGLLAPDAMAQANPSAVTNSVNTTLGMVAQVLRAGGAMGATIAVIMLAYKAMFVENFKILTDGKGLFIGAILFGAAGVIGQLFV